MAKQENLKERMDTIKANSVTDREFEDTWGVSIDAQVDKMMERWDTLLAQAREAIENDHQPADERQQPAAEEQADSAERKEETNSIGGVILRKCKSLTFYYVKECPKTNNAKKVTKAEKAKAMKKLSLTLKKIFENYDVEMSQHESKKTTESVTLGGLVTVDLDHIENEEERDQITRTLDEAIPCGHRISPSEVPVNLDDYDILELCVKHKLRCKK